MMKGLTEKQKKTILEVLKTSDDPAAVSNFIFGIREFGEFIEYSKTQDEIIEHSISIKQKRRFPRGELFHREQEDSIIQLLANIKDGIDKMNSGLKELNRSQQNEIIPSFLVNFQEFIQNTISEFPAILEVYLEQSLPNRVIVYFTIIDDLSYKNYKPVARFQNIVLDRFSEQISDFKIIRFANLETISKRKLIKII